MKQIIKSNYLIAGIIVICLSIAFTKVNAQVNSYSFVQSAGTYTAISGGTVIATATDSSGNGSLDNIIYDLPAGTIPFSFNFDNVGYTGCKISTNGFITFGATAPAISGSTTGYTPLSAVTAYSGAISILGRNLNSYFIPGNAAQTGELRYQTLGAAPNRTFVIQFKNFKNATTGNTYGSVLNLQIRLTETTNVINMVYSCSGSFGSSPSQVGLRGANNTFPTNIKNRSVVNGTNIWLTSIAGVANNSTCEFITGNIPPLGLTYTFSPLACPASQNLGVANVTQTTAQLTWTSSGGGGTFKVEYGLSGFAPGTGTVINNAVSPQPISGLVASTNYQFYVQQNCGASGNSSNAGPYSFQTGGPGEDCASAILVTVKANLGACGYSVVTSGVSQNGINAICSDATGNVPNDDRWLKFVAPANGKKIVIFTTAGTVNDWVMQVWKSCSGNSSDVIKCADDDNAFMPQITLCQNEYVPGQTYYIRAWTYSPPAVGTMNLCIYEDTPCPVPPSNDECNVATLLSVNQSGACPGNAATFTTLDATPSGNIASCDASTNQRDVWFVFNTDIYGDIKITFSLISATNLKAQLYFDCNGGELYCWNPADGLSKTMTGLNPNADYILRVWSDSIGPGSFTVCMSDACSNPTATLTGTQSICPGGTAQMYVDFTGSAPYSFSYTDGTTTVPVVTSNTPYSLLVSPSSNKTYSLLSMSDATCAGSVSGTAVVTVATPPTVTLANFTPICSNNGLIALSGGSPIGGLYSGTGVTGGTFNPTVGTQTITYTVNFGIGCNRSASKVYTVNTAPTVSLLAFTPICSNSGLQTLSGGSPAGGIFTGTGVSAGKFNPASGSQSITYTYTSANNCVNSASQFIVVNTAPIVFLSAFNPVCSNAGLQVLSGGFPAGGIYSGTGVSTGNFNPTVGSQNITYNYSDANGCSGSANQLFTVNTAPNVTLAAFTPVCSNAGLQTLTGGLPAGGTYSGTGVSGGSFNPLVGTQTITYNYTNANSCTGSASQLFTVNTAPNVTLAAFTPVCSNAGLQTLTGGLPAGGTYSGTGVSAGNFNPTVGSQNITYNYSDANGCSGSATRLFTVNTIPIVTLGSYTSVCTNTTPFALTGGSPAGGTYSGTGVSGGNFSPGVAGAGTFVITYTYTNASGCTAAAISSITVNVCGGCANPPTAFAGVDKSSCGTSGVAVTGTRGGAATSSSWSSTGTGSFNPNNTALAITYIPTSVDVATGFVKLILTTDDPDGAGPCNAAIDTMIITITAGPSTGSITGSTGVCVPVNGQPYNVVAQSGVTFTWTVPANVSITSGQGTNSISSNWPANASNGTVCVTATNSCGSSLPTCKTVTKRTTMPGTVGVITGSTNGCNGETKVYTVRKLATADFYIWTPPIGATINGSSAPFNTVDTIVSVTFTAAFPSVGDTLRVVAGNCVGTSATERKLKINKNLPATPGTVSGLTTGLCNQSNVPYSIVAVTGATSYTWSTAIVGASINGLPSPVTTTVPNIVMSFGTFTTGSLIVKANNGCGSSGNRTRTLSARPATPGVISGLATVCANANGVAYSIAPVVNATSYTWTPPSGATIATGQGATNVTVNYGATTGVANLIVRANGIVCGNSANRSLAITRNLCPRIEDGLITSENFMLNVFPNPTHSTIKVQFNAMAVSDYKIWMTDIAGRVVLNDAINGVAGENNFELNLNSIASGVYTLILQSNKETNQIKIFKD